MFEAFGRNKYVSTGVIQWMLNNAWPSMIWHLYDYYLRPGGSYFGAKKGCELLHVQYSYDDRSIVVVNSYYQAFPRTKVTARVYNLDMTEKFSREAVLEAAPDSSTRVFVIPEIAGLTATYFVRLALEDSAGKTLGSNFYWLSTKPEVLDWDKSDWYHTPTRSFADFTALQGLPQVDLKLTSASETQGSEGRTRVTVVNPGRSLAFFIRLKVNKSSDGEEILPVLWEDNYFSLLPGERREIAASYRTRDLGRAKPVVELQGWNVKGRTW
jgi:exo-1,4-beta-D-glucosaminidase